MHSREVVYAPMFSVGKCGLDFDVGVANGIS